MSQEVGVARGSVGELETRAGTLIHILPAVPEVIVTEGTVEALHRVWHGRGQYVEGNSEGFNSYPLSGQLCESITAESNLLACCSGHLPGQLVIGKKDGIYGDMAV